MRPPVAALAAPVAPPGGSSPIAPPPGPAPGGAFGGAAGGGSGIAALRVPDVCGPPAAGGSAGDASPTTFVSAVAHGVLRSDSRAARLAPPGRFASARISRSRAPEINSKPLWKEQHAMERHLTTSTGSKSTRNDGSTTGIGVIRAETALNRNTAFERSARAVARPQPAPPARGERERPDAHADPHRGVDA